MSRKVIEIRSLIKGSLKKVTLSPDIINRYESWKKLMEENNQEFSELDIFYAGYILSNPVVNDILKYSKIKPELLDEN